MGAKAEGGMHLKRERESERETDTVKEQVQQKEREREGNRFEKKERYHP